MMNETPRADFSLLWRKGGEEYTEISPVTANDLGLSALINALSEDTREREALRKILLKMPTNIETIRYRQEILDDLRGDLALCEELRRVFDEAAFGAVLPPNTRKAGIWDLLQAFRSLSHYADAMRHLNRLFEGRKFRSEGLSKLQSFVEKTCAEAGFEALDEDLRTISDDAAAVRSMTIGVNLDTEFVPTEAGIVSLNAFSYTEKGVLEKYTQFHRKRHPEDPDLTPFTFLSHNSNAADGRDILMNNLTNIIEEMLPQLKRRLKTLLSRYGGQGAEILAGLGGEMLLYLRFLRLEQSLKGLSFCRPEISNDGTRFEGLYNIRLALLGGKEPVIGNDLAFERSGRVIILTGRNRGGKTILTQGVALAVLLFQQGLDVPGTRAEIEICDGIYTHFPADENQTLSYGRLGEEAARFCEISKHATQKSLVLCNESFATTMHAEALYIARDALKYLCALGARAVYNTHMTELAENLDALRSEKSRVGAVSAVMEEGFHLRFKAPEGKAYAEEIARRFQITFEQLCENLPGEENHADT